MIDKKEITVIIVDDEPLAIERISTLLNADNEFKIVAECQNGKDAIKQVNKLEPDLLFLDIQMPGMDGFEVLENIKSKNMPTTIFVTAHDQYAIKAFELFALDYLLKPFDKSRFTQTLNRAKEHAGRKEKDKLTFQLEGLLNEIKYSKLGKNKKYIDRFVIKSGGSIYFINADEIDMTSVVTVPTHLAKQYFRIQIIDSGHGIKQKDISRIFDPFFTTKEVGKGTGLGLSMIYRYITAINGMIDIKGNIPLHSK